MSQPLFIQEAFNSLRDPRSDPDGLGRNWCLTVAEVEGVRHWVITAVSRNKEGGETHLPLFFHLLPGTKVKVGDQEEHVVSIEDFTRRPKHD